MSSLKAFYLTALKNRLKQGVHTVSPSKVMLGLSLVSAVLANLIIATPVWAQAAAPFDPNTIAPTNTLTSPWRGYGAGPAVAPTPNSSATQAPGQAPLTANSAPARMVLPNKPITPFQQFVFEATGRLLPYYGEHALQKTLSAEASNTPVSADYELGAGDEVQLRISGSIDTQALLVVDRNGKLTIPAVGTFPVLGVKARDLDAHLSQQVGRYFKNFTLSTALGRVAGLNIYVAGQALVPGMHMVAGTSTLASAALGIAQPGVNGSFRRVELRRGGQTVAQFDLYDLLRNGRLDNDRKLQTGDVLFVANAGPRLAVQVDGPQAAIVELRPNETLDDILKLLGIDQTLLRQDQVLIESFEVSKATTPKAVTTMPLAQALQQSQWRDGDVLTLLAAPRSFTNAVTLKGNVATPARYPFAAGMTIADLIPNTEALLQADYFKKKSALVGFDRNRADRTLQDDRLLQELSPEEQDQYLKRYAQRQQMREGQTLSQNKSDGSTSQDSQSASFTKSNGRSNPSFAPLSANNDNKNRLDEVEDSIKNLLPQINWDYAVIERLDRTSLQATLVPFNLRKAMARDPQHNLPLQAGDVVTVFSANDGDIPKTRKTALIKVTGEVGSPGFYQVNAGETLRDVLVRAGGLAPNAFLYGTKLTRRSLLRQQEELYNKALDQAERLLQVAMTRASASSVNPADASRVQTQADSQQRYMAKLRASRPDGRVVLNVPPSASSMGQLPPLALEDGDVVHVPSVPGQVAVFGAVYTQGAFSYEAGRHVWDYLSMAGGAARGSDKGSIFVLRANGSVESAQQGWLPLVNGLRGARALPGDTVYVPEDFERVSFMKGLLDVSQVFYQVGLGAAAINAIRD